MMEKVLRSKAAMELRAENSFLDPHFLRDRSICVGTVGSFPGERHSKNMLAVVKIW